MNYILDIAGHFLNIALRIILLPVFMTLDIFLGAWATAKFIKRWSRALPVRIKRKQPAPHFVFKKSLVLLKAKSIGVPVNH